MPIERPSSENRKEASRYWTRDDLAGLELLWGCFRRHAYRPHSHPGYVIAVVTAGVEAVNCNGVLYRAGPGDILFVNPEEIHDGQRGVDAGWQYRVFYPTVAAMRDLVADGGNSHVTPYFINTVVHDPDLAQRLTQFHSAVENGQFPFGEQSVWTELLGELVTRYSSFPGPVPSDRPEQCRIRRVRELIEADFDKSLSLERLADEAQLSQFHLLRLFKAAVGVAPHAYLIALRLRRAKALLDRRISAAEAAIAVGFVDQSHFIKHFKSAYGFTPGQYAAARSAHS